jgi:hypothetical protein
MRVISFTIIIIKQQQQLAASFIRVQTRYEKRGALHAIFDTPEKQV